MKVYIEVFAMGVALGWGPCLSFCAPILLPYIGATQKGWLEGLKATVVFSISRIFPYVILSLISATVGQFLISRFYESKGGLIIYILAGAFIFLLGLMVFIGKSVHLNICKFLSKHFCSEGVKGMVLLGMVVGLLPCVPLLGLLTYIAFTSKNLIEGVFLGLTFGIGTLISPLILFGSLTGEVSSLLFKKPLFYKIFSRICGLILMYLGIEMLIKVLIR